MIISGWKPKWLLKLDSRGCVGCSHVKTRYAAKMGWVFARHPWMWVPFFMKKSFAMGPTSPMLAKFGKFGVFLTKSQEMGTFFQKNTKIWVPSPYEKLPVNMGMGLELPAVHPLYRDTSKSPISPNLTIPWRLYFQKTTPTSIQNCSCDNSGPF